MILTTNTILYCDRWVETVTFYRECLNLDVVFSTTWFVEFRLSDRARLSIADASHATVPSSHGHGITLSLEVASIEDAHRKLTEHGANPTSIRPHAWGARVFNVIDPEKNRIEFWCPDTQACIHGN